MAESELRTFINFIILFKKKFVVKEFSQIISELKNDIRYFVNLQFVFI